MPTDTRAAIGTDNHCPFGCEVSELDDHGYCDHLVGFTNDGKVIEKVFRDDKGITHVSSKKTDEVQKADKLVNPERVIEEGAIKRIAKSWVSDRVYRRSAKTHKE